jgi:hypothetical protein
MKITCRNHIRSLSRTPERVLFTVLIHRKKVALTMVGDDVSNYV